MANLYSGTSSFTGYKTLAELTGLTFTKDNTYTIQVTAINSNYYVREGTTGNGFVQYEATPFTWTYDGSNMLYIGNNYAKSIVINVAG